MSVTLYVEGGGDDEALKTELRQGVTEFLRRAGFVGRLPRVVACGARHDAFDRFRTALAVGRTYPVLLVDSEAPLPEGYAPGQPGHGPWDHLSRRDRWDRPEQATDDHVHLMVQCMEAWFLADREALEQYYGHGFRSNALPGNRHPEQVSKPDLYRSLTAATRDTRTKGAYSKGGHSFEILALLAPARVRTACPSAERFLAFLHSKLTQP